ncbi:MAG: CRISPR-associated protein Csx16 [Xanthomonadaceae bacterium]|nr:CRISPR-associated protein Csx16 [Xanthomonadaceae bacterium]
MTVWIVSRHPGALEWLRRQGITGREVAHLDLGQVAAGDKVVGTLPISMVAELCALGACYYHLELNLLREQRGRELSADELDAAGARLVPYEARRVEDA